MQFRKTEIASRVAAVVGLNFFRVRCRTEALEHCFAKNPIR